MDYEKAYHRLFNEMTDALIQLNLLKEMTVSIQDTIILNLKSAQQTTEEWYLEAEGNQ